MDQADARPRPVKERISERWRSAIPLGTPTPPALMAIIGLGLFAATFGRVAYQLGGSIWAEDGEVLLTQQYAKGITGTFLLPAAGYIEAPSRLITAIAAQFPIALHADLMILGSALVQLACALTAFVFVRAHRGDYLPALLGAIGVALCPVGAEVYGAATNVQWFLLPAAVLATLYMPISLFGRIASGVLVVAATLASPFAVIAVVCAALAFIATRTRFHAALTGSGVVGLAIQVVCDARAPQRDFATRVRLERLIAGYIERVLGDGFFGAGHYNTYANSASPWLGLIVGFLVAVLVVERVRASDVWTVVPGLFVALCSFAIYAGPIVLTDSDTINVTSWARYYVPPVILLYAAVAILAPRDLRPSWPRVERSVDAYVVAGLGVALTFALVSSVSLPTEVRLPNPTPTWSDGIQTARNSCELLPTDATVAVPVQFPPGWATTIPCRLLR